MWHNNSYQDSYISINSSTSSNFGNIDNRLVLNNGTFGVQSTTSNFGNIDDRLALINGTFEVQSTTNSMDHEIIDITSDTSSSDSSEDFNIDRDAESSSTNSRYEIENSRCYSKEVMENIYSDNNEPDGVGRARQWLTENVHQLGRPCEQKRKHVNRDHKSTLESNGKYTKTNTYENDLYSNLENAKEDTNQQWLYNNVHLLGKSLQQAINNSQQ